MSFLRGKRLGAGSWMREVEERTKSNLSQWHSMIDDSVKLWNLRDEFFKKIRLDCSSFLEFFFGFQLDFAEVAYIINFFYNNKCGTLTLFIL